MASVKVVQVRKTLEQFAELYERAGCHQDAQAVRLFCDVIKKADKRTVDDLANTISTSGQQPAETTKVSSGH